MSKFTEILAAAAIPIVSAVVAEQVTQALNTFKDHNPADVVAEAVKGGHSGLKLLAKVVEGTKSKLDDTAIGVLLTTVEAFASENGIEL